MKYDPSQLNRPRAHDGAGAAPRPDPPPSRAGPRRDGLALGRRLGGAGDCPPSGVLRRYRAHGAQAVRADRPDELTPQAPRPTEGSGACRTRNGGPQPPAGRAADVDRAAVGPRPTGGGHPTQHAADAQVSQAAGRQLAADRSPPQTQTRSRPGGASEAEAGPPGKRGPRAGSNWPTSTSAALRPVPR